MLLLIFSLGEERYAIDSGQVAEVIPLVNLRPLFQVPDYVLGMFNYRGRIVPVLDLGRLIQGNPCRSRLSSRIIMVNYALADGRVQPLGLVAERVTDTLTRESLPHLGSSLGCRQTTYLGEVIQDERGMIQCLRLGQLLSPEQQAMLTVGNDQSNDG